MSEAASGPSLDASHATASDDTAKRRVTGIEYRRFYFEKRASRSHVVAHPLGTTNRSATRPNASHPMHRHDVGASELAIAGGPSTVAVASKRGALERSATGCGGRGGIAASRAVRRGWAFQGMSVSLMTLGLCLVCSVMVTCPRVGVGAGCPDHGQRRGAEHLQERRLGAREVQLKRSGGAIVQAKTSPVGVMPVAGGATMAPVNESVYAVPADGAGSYRSDGTQSPFIWDVRAARRLYQRIGISFDDGRRRRTNVGLR